MAMTMRRTLRFPISCNNYDKFGSGRILFQIGEIRERTDVTCSNHTYAEEANIELYVKWRDDAKEAIRGLVYYWKEERSR